MCFRSDYSENHDVAKYPHRRKYNNVSCTVELPSGVKAPSRSFSDCDSTCDSTGTNFESALWRYMEVQVIGRLRVERGASGAPWCPLIQPLPSIDGFALGMNLIGSGAPVNTCILYSKRQTTSLSSEHIRTSQGLSSPLVSLTAAEGILLAHTWRAKQMRSRSLA